MHNHLNDIDIYSYQNQYTSMNTTLTIKLPKDLRDNAKKTAAAMGLPLTTVIQRQLRDFVDKREVTFVAPVDLVNVDKNTLSLVAKNKLEEAQKIDDADFMNL